MADASTHLTGLGATRTQVNYGYFDDSVINNNALYYFLNQRNQYKVVDGGNDFETNVMVNANPNAQSFGAGQALNTTVADPNVTPSYNMRRYGCPTTVDKHQLRINRGGDARVIRYGLVQSTASQSGLKNLINADTAVGNGEGQPADATALEGISAAVRSDTAAASVGGVSGANNPNWRCNVTTVFGDFATNWRKKMMAGYTSAKQAKQVPDVLFSISDIWIAYWEQLHPLTRYKDTTAANAGFENLTFRGKPWVWDDDFDEGTIRMVNLSKVMMKILSGANFDLSDWVDAAPQGLDAYVSFMVWTATLCWYNLNRHWIGTGITGV